MSVDSAIESMRKENLIYRFERELESIQTKSDVMTETDELRVNKITDILSKLTGKKKNIVKEDISVQKNKMFDEINKIVYSQPWVKLHTIHKEVKLKEYIEEKYKDNPNMEHIRADLLEKYHDKKIPSRNVEYNTKLGRIESIKNYKIPQF